MLEEYCSVPFRLSLRLPLPCEIRPEISSSSFHALAVWQVPEQARVVEGLLRASIVCDHCAPGAVLQQLSLGSLSWRVDHPSVHCCGVAVLLVGVSVSRGVTCSERASIETL
jgi:hypothetical protein